MSDDVIRAALESAVDHMVRTEAFSTFWAPEEYRALATAAIVGFLRALPTRLEQPACMYAWQHPDARDEWAAAVERAAAEGGDA